MAKVLIVEDDEATRRLMVLMVQKAGHITIQSPNGRHAFETLCCNPDIAMMITDIMMPEMDGHQLVRLVRGNESFRALPILMVSAVVGVREITDLLEMGVTAFLPKPIQKDDLMDYLSRYLDVDEN